MLELATVALTIGAIMFHSFDILTIVYIGTLLAISLSVFFRTWKGIFFGLIIGATLILGALSIWRIDIPPNKNIFGNRAFTARVESVDRRLDRTIVIIKNEAGQKLQASILGKVDYMPGDYISIRGSVVEPRDFATDTGRIFEYKYYLNSKGIVGIINNPQIELIEEGKFSITKIATDIRYSVSDILSRYVLFPVDGVIAGMTVGYQGSLPKETQDLFRDTGVLHVLVLSGYNITLLAGFLALLMRALSFRLRSVITILAIIMLVFVSGAGVASIRAGIMGSIALFAGLAIRTYQPVRALFLAYILFFFITPQTIFSDPGFHLSFLATLFMVSVLPKVEKLFHFIPNTKHVDIREIIMLAVTIPIFMLPYIMYFSGSFPLVSPIANILFAIVTPIFMCIGILIIILSWLVPVATFIGFIISIFGKMILWVLEIFSKLPQWHTPELSGSIVSIIYVVILFLLFRKEIIAHLWQLYNTLRQQTNSDF